MVGIVRNPAGPVIGFVNKVVHPEMCKGKRVEEDEVQERRDVREPGTDITRNREQGKVCPADDLGEREDLRDSLLLLVEYLDRETIRHDEQHVD